MGLEELSKIDIEAEILKDLENELTKSFEDNMSYLLLMMYWKEQGWHTVKLSRFQDNHHAVDITYWLAEQDLKDKEDYYREGSEFVFRESKHATLFALRWV